MTEPVPDPAAKRCVLVVDDTPDNLALVSGLLKDLYRVRVANGGEKALKLARETPPPDLILLDVMMPGVSGYEVCRDLKADPTTRDVPIIFLTSMTEEEDEEQGLALGAVDYVAKPIRPAILLARIAAQLELKGASDFLRDKASYLESEVRKRTSEVSALQDVTVLALASLAETRDVDTGNHIRRTQYYVRALAEKLRHHPRFRDFLNDRTIELLFKTAPLHDLGKVGIPDRILLKPGRLDADEYEVMKTHTTLGRDALRHAVARLGVEVEFLRFAQEIAYGHQEKWDGTGYPEGIGGDDIPVAARLMAVADVYDAVVSRRVYKEARAHEVGLEVIANGRGTHFDPDMADAFLAIEEEIRAIAQRFRDEDADLAAKAAALEARGGSA